MSATSTQTAVFTLQSNGTYSLTSGGGTTAGSCGFSSMLPMYGGASVESLSIE